MLVDYPKQESTICIKPITACSRHQQHATQLNRHLLSCFPIVLLACKMAFLVASGFDQCVALPFGHLRQHAAQLYSVKVCKTLRVTSQIQKGGDLLIFSDRSVTRLACTKSDSLVGSSFRRCSHLPGATRLKYCWKALYTYPVTCLYWEHPVGPGNN